MNCLRKSKQRVGIAEQTLQRTISNEDGKLPAGSVVHRRECWSLTWRAWMALLLGTAILGLLGFGACFLPGANKPIKSDALVVEGYARLRDDAARSEFEQEATSS